MNRRHYIGLATALLFSLLTTYLSAAQMQTQILLGLNRTTLTGESDSDFSPATRFSASIGLGFALSGGFFIQPEVTYSVKGASVEGLVDFPETEEPVPVLARSTITYFEFPLLLGYNFGGESIRPRIFAGPYLARKLNSKINYEASEGGPSFTDTDESVVNWDHGFILGAAVHFPLGEEEFAFGVRASIGLADLTEAIEGEELNQSLSNQSIGLYGAILF